MENCFYFVIDFHFDIYKYYKNQINIKYTPKKTIQNFKKIFFFVKCIWINK